jgi:hypothetical protein
MLLLTSGHEVGNSYTAAKAAQVRSQEKSYLQMSTQHTTGLTLLLQPRYNVRARLTNICRNTSSPTGIDKCSLAKEEAKVWQLRLVKVRSSGNPRRK